MRVMNSKPMSMAGLVLLLERAVYREMERAILQARWVRMGRPRLAGGKAGRPWEATGEGKGLRK